MLDLLEEAKDRVIVAPSIALMHTMLNDAAPFGITKDIANHMGMSKLLESSIETHSALRKRGIKHVIGGDYGLLFAPNGQNARDIKHFVDYYGYTPEQALQCATRNGGLMFYDDGSLGTLEQGSHADLLLVHGNPLKDLNLLVNAENLLLIMKGGQIHKDTTGTVTHNRRSAA
jgi:imidazolonepropionase-like amidohydrolase